MPTSENKEVPVEPPLVEETVEASEPRRIEFHVKNMNIHVGDDTHKVSNAVVEVRGEYRDPPPKEEVYAEDSVGSKAPPEEPVEKSVGSERIVTSRHSASTDRPSGMESSVLRFKDINFVVGSGEKQKHILMDVNGKVRWGRVLAIMGPSGAGKTTLINVLTMDAHFGRPTGSVTLNGVPMTDKIFKKHCYVVKQHDKHWPYLTCRETLMYCAELYEVAPLKKDCSSVVDRIIQKMGLNVCRDTRCARLSGGQRRRLSIGIALLKSPTVLFLDEPTTGLDAASAENIMQEIVRVAKEERIIIVCTIHQPSTKVYEGFDQVMILSKGREAYTGDVSEAVPYFESIGYPLPLQTNPAEHFLDLVNADFSSEEEVDHILNTWEEKRPQGAGSSHHKKGLDDPEGQKGVSGGNTRSFGTELNVMFRRHFSMMVRDPVLYLGRTLVALVTNMVFGIVYWSARDFTQDQVVNKVYIVLWYVGVSSNFAVVAVYALNDEFKSILRETKNGMVTPMSYALVKSIMVIPFMYIFSLFALGIPGYALQSYGGYSFGKATLLWTVCLYVFENVSELFAVSIENPILGILQVMNYWFAAFLFSGLFLAERDLYWPFTLFYHIMPYSYYMRSALYATLSEATWDNCEGGVLSGQAICVPDGNPIQVLEEVGKVFPCVDPKDTVWRDLAVIFALAVLYKIMYLIAVQYQSSKVAKLHASPP